MQSEITHDQWMRRQRLALSSIDREVNKVVNAKIDKALADGRNEFAAAYHQIQLRVWNYESIDMRRYGRHLQDQAISRIKMR